MNNSIKAAAKLLLYYSPKSLKQALMKKKTERELKECMARNRRTKVTKEELKKLIDSIPTDTDWFLHTSMANVGKIEGGPKFITQALLDALDLTLHTLLVSALPYRGSFHEYLNTDPTFDVRTADVAMGAVNERLASMPEAKRSIHPTHSVVAIGAKAEAYVEGHERDNTPFGEHSPYLKIFQNDGVIVLLGATLDNVTALHALEDEIGEAVYPYDIYDHRDYRVKCFDAEGKELTVSTKCHNPRRCLLRDGELMRPELEARGVMHTLPFGESELIWIKARDYAACYLDMLAHGKGIYGRKHKVTAELMKRIDYLRQELKI